MECDRKKEEETAKKLFDVKTSQNGYKSVPQCQLLILTESKDIKVKQCYGCILRNESKYLILQPISAIDRCS